MEDCTLLVMPSLMSSGGAWVTCAPTNQRRLNSAGKPACRIQEQHDGLRSKWCIVQPLDGQQSRFSVSSVV